MTKILNHVYQETITFMYWYLKVWNSDGKCFEPSSSTRIYNVDSWFAVLGLAQKHGRGMVRIICFKILTLPKSFILKIDITFISDTWCRFDYRHLHQNTVHTLEPVILILDKPHHLLYVITIN